MEFWFWLSIFSLSLFCLTYCFEPHFELLGANDSFLHHFLHSYFFVFYDFGLFVSAVRCCWLYSLFLRRGNMNYLLHCLMNCLLKCCFLFFLFI